jgi:hypothetical protein
MVGDPSTTQTGFKITGQLIIGLFVILIGVLFALDELGIAHAERFFQYWPVVIIVIGLVKLSQSGSDGGGLVGVTFILVGSWLLLEETGFIRISFFSLWPMLLVLVGAYLVWQGLTGRQLPQANGPGTPPADDIWTGGRSCGTAGVAPSSTESDGTSRMSAMAILGGVSRGNNSKTFRAADLVAIMGGCEIDLRKAAINGEAVIDVFAIWGGIEIRVPEDWTVVSQVTPLLGGVDDKTRPPQGATAHRLTLRGVAIMGGVEIKN